MKPLRNAVVAIAAVVAALALGGSALFSKVLDLIDDNEASIARSQEAIKANRDLGCRVGGFLVGTPIIKQPGISEQVFQKEIDKVQEFLIALRHLDCRGLGHVTAAKIKQQQKALRALKGGVNQSGTPPGQQPGSGVTVPPPTPSPAPAPSPPPTTPPPTTTTPSPGGGDGGDGILQRVCHLNLLGVHVCVRM